MTLTYVWRLFVSCFASFCLTGLALTLAVWALSPALIRFAKSLNPRRGAGLLFAVRIFPTIAGLAVVGLLCLPSYLWLEPQIGIERVGVFCLLVAICGFVLLAAGLSFGGFAFVQSIRFVCECRQNGRSSPLNHGEDAAMVLCCDAPLVALAGVLRPRLLISRAALQALSQDQVRLAVRHERSHQAAWDNFKRLLFVSMPVPFPFRSRFRAIERHWAKLSEWAADDEATGLRAGDSVLLAEALLRLARMAPYPARPQLMSLFNSESEDFAERIERLLRSNAPPHSDSPNRFRRFENRLWVIVLLLAIPLANPATLSFVHECMEQLVR